MRLFLLSIVLLFAYTYTYSQSEVVGISKKFFTTENFRLGAAIGADASWAGDDGSTALISQSGNIDDDNFFYASEPNTTIFLGLDAYSPTSILGFLGGVALNFQEYSVRGQNDVRRDSIKTTNIEIPIYARLRLGNALSQGQFWIALGGGYSINSRAETSILNATGGIISSSERNEQFDSHAFASGILGYEFMFGNKEKDAYDRDAYRILIYAKANYDLGNRLDPENIEPTTAIATYQEPSIEFLRISVGIKFMLRLSKAGELLGAGLQKGLN